MFWFIGASVVAAIFGADYALARRQKRKLAEGGKYHSSTKPASSATTDTMIVQAHANNTRNTSFGAGFM